MERISTTMRYSFDIRSLGISKWQARSVELFDDALDIVGKRLK